MAVSQSTVDEITNWYQSIAGRAPDAEGLNYWSSQAASGGDMNALRSTFVNSATEVASRGGEKLSASEIQANAANYGMLGAPTTSTASTSAPTTAATSAAAAAASGGGGASPDVGNWYRTVYGRDAEAGGLDYWKQQLASGKSADDVFTAFRTAGQITGERYANGAPTTWQQASTYSGPQSVNTTTPVDDWFRNTMGREATVDELQTWQSKFDAAGAGGVEAARQVYNDFLKANAAEVKYAMDSSGASQINPGLKPKQGTINVGPTYLDLDQLDRRNIDPNTETVQGQMLGLLKNDSPYLAQARYDAMKMAAERGMLNSTMAASAGEDAAIRSALGIAAPDAGYYNKAADYNVALRNEARKWNAEQANQFALNQQNFFNQAELQRLQQGHQLTLAQLQDATDRWKTQTQDATSRYNTDQQYKQQADNNKKSLVNNVMMNMDLSPDRKAAMLEALGEGKAAKKEKQADGSYKVTPGTGLAGAVYIITDVGDELRQAAVNAGANPADAWQGAGN
jgi:hypothetical protein